MSTPVGLGSFYPFVRFLKRAALIMERQPFVSFDYF